MSQSSAQTADGKRKRRFKRQPEGFIQLTERDAAIIKAVYRHRFLRSTHILALFGGGQGLLRRLAELYHHAYLDRPREQIEFYQNAGSKPMVYALGNRGRTIFRTAKASRAARSIGRRRTMLSGRCFSNTRSW